MVTVGGGDDSTIEDLFRDRPLWNNGYDAPGGARGRKVEEAELVPTYAHQLPMAPSSYAGWSHLSSAHPSGTCKEVLVDNLLNRQSLDHNTLYWYSL